MNTHPNGLDLFTGLWDGLLSLIGGLLVWNWRQMHRRIDTKADSNVLASLREAIDRKADNSDIANLRHDLERWQDSQERLQQENQRMLIRIFERLPHQDGGGN